MVVAAFARFHERVFKIAEDISDVVTGRQTELRGIARQPGHPEIRSH
jgi:hypothetical protein